MCYLCGCSCSCGDNPCGCQEVVCSQCSTTTTSTTTLDPNCEPCDEMYDCTCIIYNGPDLQCYGIYNGDNLCKILYIAASNLPEVCVVTTTTIPPTTTTTTCACNNYLITNEAFSQSGQLGAVYSVKYTPCENKPGSTKILYVTTRENNKTICSRDVPTRVAGTGTIESVNGPCCGLVTTTTAAPAEAQRCTADTYFAIEDKFTDFPITIILYSMSLNGIAYGTQSSSTLIINSLADVSIGVGLDGNSYIMNISDWLTRIAAGSGFVFHDNMKVIDYPYAGSTLYMELTMTDPGGTRSYYYDSVKGFGWGDAAGTYVDWVGTYKCEPLKRKAEIATTG